MDSDVITAQPVSGAQVTSTDSDKPPSYYDVMTSQPHRGNNDNVADCGENLDNGHEDASPEQKNNEEEDNKKHNRRQADDCCVCCYVGEDDDCVFLRLFLNCCIGIRDCTASCGDCMHECCEPDVLQAESNDNSCCVDCCGVGDSGDNGVDCCGAGDSGDNSADCDCNCFD